MLDGLQEPTLQTVTSSSMVLTSNWKHRVHVREDAPGDITVTSLSWVHQSV